VDRREDVHCDVLGNGANAGLGLFGKHNPLQAAESSS
jgi:hypothetical protein